MSTLIFGSLPVQSLDTRLVKLLAVQRDPNTLDVQILCSQSLQYWQVSISHSAEKNSWKIPNNFFHFQRKLFDIPTI